MGKNQTVAEALGSWDWVSFENIKKRVKELTEKIPNVNKGKLTTRAKGRLEQTRVRQHECGTFPPVFPKGGQARPQPDAPPKAFGPEEVFRSLIRAEERQRAIQGIRASRKGPRVSHLFFTDDALIFCQATQKAMLCVREVLRHFEVVFGLMINLEKLTGVFSKNTPELVNKDLIGILEVPMVDKHTKYLGLPLVVDRSKRAIFECIKERIWKRFQGWSVQRLSHAGRVVMIKSIIQAIPTYAMSCFKIPKALLSEIENMITSFFWQQDGD
ncbi:UNVERIFIED_CONTAM: hypothetical protein Sradi_0927200 [Sesamum radiatum]|uniref:Reverse transcriptase n=1 Tax=Sesamum radiatum TaxID=300843 RepID=A0AAW2V2S2_SESRA